MRAALLVLIPIAAATSPCDPISQVSTPWSAQQAVDLHREYNNIFRYGNRNAASHLWAKFLLERSNQMDHDRLTTMFSGFCAVSGSPVRPQPYNRYGLILDKVGGGKVQGFMHYCCWPCVCDTQDFIKVDTKNITIANGVQRQYHFTVIGNPCLNEDALTKPFVDAFGRGMETLRHSAPEVRCENGVLLGAPLSDHGHIIINMFFDPIEVDSAVSLEADKDRVPQPGRMTTRRGPAGDIQYQDEFEFKDMCEQRKQRGYNSGMGEIFRKVAEISPIDIHASSNRCSAEKTEKVVEISRQAGQPLGFEVDHFTMRIAKVGQGLAKDAGVQVGWKILRLGDTTVQNTDELFQNVKAAGTNLRFTFAVE